MHCNYATTSASSADVWINKRLWRQVFKTVSLAMLALTGGLFIISASENLRD